MIHLLELRSRFHRLFLSFRFFGGQRDPKTGTIRLPGPVNPAAVRFGDLPGHRQPEPDAFALASDEGLKQPAGNVSRWARS